MKLQTTISQEDRFEIGQFLHCLLCNTLGAHTAPHGPGPRVRSPTVQWHLKGYYNVLFKTLKSAFNILSAGELLKNTIKSLFMRICRSKFPKIQLFFAEFVENFKSIIRQTPKESVDKVCNRTSNLENYKSKQNLSNH